MRNILSALFTSCFVLFTLVSIGQGKESMTIEEPFDGLKVFGPFELEIVTQESGPTTVDIEYTNIDRDQFEAKVEKGTLSFKLKTPKIKDLSIKVKVTTSGVKHLQTGAGGAIFSNEMLYADFMVMKANSGGSIEASISVDRLDLKITQGAECRLTGDAKKGVLEANTGGFIDLSGFDAEELEVESNTGAEVFVKGGNSLKMSAATAGTITYTGSPENISVSTSLGGEIEKKEE